MCPHKSTHTKEGRRGGRPFRLKRGGANIKKEPKEKERYFVFSVCVCVSFVFFLCIPSFLCHERGCWQHHHHSSLNKVCIYYTLFLSTSRRQRILLLLLKGTYDATAKPDRSIFRDVVVYVVVYVVVGFRFHRVGKERRLFGLERLVYISSRDVRHHRR